MHLWNFWDNTAGKICGTYLCGLRLRERVGNFSPLRKISSVCRSPVLRRQWGYGPALWMVDYNFFHILLLPSWSLHGYWLILLSNGGTGAWTTCQRLLCSRAQKTNYVIWLYANEISYKKTWLQQCKHWHKSISQLGEWEGWQIL